MVYPTNQNRHLYVINAYNENVTNSSAAGTIGGVQVTDGFLGKELHFLYRGAAQIGKSDNIQVQNISYIKALTPEEMRIPLKQVELTLDSTVNGGAPIAGQDYVLRIQFRQFHGMSDSDIYIKDAAVHAVSGMSASTFYKKMVEALNLAFSREVGASKTSNPYLTFTAPLKGGSGADKDDATKIVITEKPQEWSLGIKKEERVLFDVFPTTVYDNADDVIWGTVENTTPPTKVVDTESEEDPQPLIANPALDVSGADQNALGNGQRIADLEWFCMGERGDQYRMVGWPKFIPTTYMVNPSAEYYVLELHHAFTDTGVNSYRSEKDITFVSTSKTAISNFLEAIKDALEEIPTMFSDVSFPE